MRGSHVIEKHS